MLPLSLCLFLPPSLSLEVVVSFLSVRVELLVYFMILAQENSSVGLNLLPFVYVQGIQIKTRIKSVTDSSSCLQAFTSVGQ